MTQAPHIIPDLPTPPHISHIYLSEFIKLYESVFEGWVNHKGAQNPPLSEPEKIAIAFDQELNQSDSLIGLIFKNPENSHCEMLAYLIVAPHHERTALSGTFIKYANELSERIRGEKIRILTHPITTSTPGDNALVKASILSKLVVAKADIVYSRSNESDEQEMRKHLFCFPRVTDSPGITGRQIAEFLFEFYKKLDVNSIRPEFQLANHVRRTLLPESNYERPQLKWRNLERVSVCLHFVERDDPTDNPFDYDDVFGSMERDLLKYQFQANPPLDSSHCVMGGSRELEIFFPLSAYFHSEGRYVELNSSRSRLTVYFMLNKTEFRNSGIRIWHLTLLAKDKDPLNEYEIIKLISLYDGRSENTGPYTKETDLARHKLAHDIKFKYGNEQPCSICDLVITLIKSFENKAKPRKIAPAIKSGTIQIMLKHKHHMDLLKQITQARSNEAAHNKILADISQKTHERNILQALSGIAIGIFDFEATDYEELLDTFEPSFSDSSIFIKFNRCTLLSIVNEDRAWDACQHSIGISPYLIIPHAVLIHNEELMEMAEEKIERLDKKKLRNLFHLRRLGKTYAEADRCLHSLYLPMIFNYPTEQELYKKGNENRGTTEKYTVVQFKLLELHSQIEGLRQTSRTLGQIFISSILGSISLKMSIGAQLEFWQILLLLFVAVCLGLGISMLGNLTFNRKSKIYN